jgi:DNA-binding CsgD family transcriptional regulator
LIRLPPDLLHIVEALYAVEQSREDWIDGIQAAASEVLGGSVGNVFYDVSGEGIGLDAIHARGLPSEAIDDAREDHVNPKNLDRIRACYRSVMCELHEVYTGGNPEDRARMTRRGIHDALLINGLDASGVGLATYLFSHDKIVLSQEMRVACERLAVHIASAYRLLRRLDELERPSIDSAAAVFSTRGKLEDMREPLARSHVDDLKRALSERDWARGRGRKEQPRKALARWTALVQGRWTLVDHFERDGKRYVIAQENAPQVNAPVKLSEREQQVASLAALGRSNKVIAYELGIAHSTVRVLLGRACARLGAQTRNELIERLNERELGAPPV